MTDDRDNGEEDRGRQKSRIPYRLILTDVFASRHPETTKVLSKHQLIYSIAGLVVGLACIIGGIILLLHNVLGSTDWTVNMLGAKSVLKKAAPGTLLFVAGLLIVYVTRYVLKIKK